MTGNPPGPSRRTPRTTPLAHLATTLHTRQEREPRLCLSTDHDRARYAANVAPAPKQRARAKITRRSPGPVGLLTGTSCLRVISSQAQSRIAPGPRQDDAPGRGRGGAEILVAGEAGEAWVEGGGDELHGQAGWCWHEVTVLGLLGRGR